MPKVHPITITAEGHLLCPVCGDEHNHIGDISAFSSDSDCGYGFDTEGHHRGGGLKLWMYCECGHKWKLHIQHHKGVTLMFASIPEDEASDKISPEEPFTRWGPKPHRFFAPGVRNFQLEV